MAEQVKKRESGIPTGNAGEYFVMSELWRRGFDAQIALPIAFCFLPSAYRLLPSTSTRDNNEKDHN